MKSIVTAMVNAKIANADNSLEDAASDRTSIVIDDEPQRRLSDDAPLSVHRSPLRNRLS